MPVAPSSPHGWASARGQTWRLDPVTLTQHPVVAGLPPHLQAACAALEAQRTVLGDVAVDAARFVGGEARVAQPVGVTGFGGGLERKKFLLTLERRSDTGTFSLTPHHQGMR